MCKKQILWEEKLHFNCRIFGDNKFINKEKDIFHLSLVEISVFLKAISENRICQDENQMKQNVLCFEKLHKLIKKREIVEKINKHRMYPQDASSRNLGGEIY